MLVITILLLPCAIQPLAAIHELNKKKILNWIKLNGIEKFSKFQALFSSLSKAEYLHAISNTSSSGLNY